MRLDRRLAAVLTAIGLALVVVGSFLPWFRSGRRARSSYELFDLVDRLDLLSEGVARVAIAGWLLVPLAAAAAAAALLLGRTTVGAMISIVVGLYTAVLASVVRSTAGRWEVGTAMATIGGIVASVGGTRPPGQHTATSSTAGGHHMSNDLPEPGAQLPAPDPGVGSTPPASSLPTPQSARRRRNHPCLPCHLPPAPVPPPEAATVTIEPAADVTLAADGAPPKGGSKGKIIAAVAAVVVLVAGVLVTVKLVSSRSEAGGAASPDEAVENMMGSLEENDLLGVLDMFAPWERDAAMGLIEDYVDNAQDAGYLADDADLSNVGGYTLTVDGLEVEPTEVNERIVNVALVGGTAHLTTQFDELPLGARGPRTAGGGHRRRRSGERRRHRRLRRDGATADHDHRGRRPLVREPLLHDGRVGSGRGRRCRPPRQRARCRRSGPTPPRRPSTR